MLELPHCLVGWATQARAEVQRSGFLFWLADSSMAGVEAALFILREALGLPIALRERGNLAMSSSMDIFPAHGCCQQSRQTQRRRQQR